MQYIGIDYLTQKFVKRFGFGASGTNMMTAEQGTAIITTCSNYIDMELSPIFGTVTPLFGTNAYGTTTVPQIIQDICADLTMGMAFENAVLTIPEKQAEWAKGIYQRGLDWLEKIKSGEWSISGSFYTGTVLTAVPAVTGGDVMVYGENITFDGTNLTYLANRTVIDNSVIVYGTQLINPPIYRRGTDYIYFPFGKIMQGTFAGYIMSTGTGSISGSFPVRVDYAYKDQPIFYENDYLKWGETSKENRG